MASDNTPAPLLLTRAQAREVDRRAMEDLGIPGIVLMENAGINATDVATGMLEACGGDGVAIVCGGGNNGGDGYVIARHLANAGRRVVVFSAADPSRLSGDAATNHTACQRMGIPILRIDDAGSLGEHAAKFAAADVLVDALLGTGYSGSQPLGPHAAAVIDAINAAGGQAGGAPLVLAVDVPSGLDCDTGEPAQPAVRADATVTFVALKRGFSAEEARPHLGEVFVVGIGTPPALTASAASS
ncbi:MAG: NAD(P)H-hydrate epimerase [Phycisphaerales bacterium JB063]